MDYQDLVCESLFLEAKSKNLKVKVFSLCAYDGVFQNYPEKKLMKKMEMEEIDR